MIIVLSILLITGFFCLIIKNNFINKLLSLSSLTITTFILVYCWFYNLNEIRFLWIKILNINFHLVLSGLSLIFSLITLGLGCLSIYISQTNINHHYFTAILWTIMNILGVFLAHDLLLFFIFWELALLPSYYLLVNSGDKNSLISYIIYTQLSSLLLLLSIIGLVTTQYHVTNIISFAYSDFINTPIPMHIKPYLLLGFILACLIKMPLVPFHDWLIKIFSSCPTPIIFILIFIKTAVYALIQFSWPIFGDTVAIVSNYIMPMGLFSLWYGALLAYKQLNLKMIIAYGTISHVGLMFMSILSSSISSYFGVIILLCAHSISSSGILMLINYIDSKININNIKSICLWQHNPKIAFFILSFLLASLGLPLFGNFLGEYLSLLGIYQQNKLLALLAALAIIPSAIYCLRLFKELCLNTNETLLINDLNKSNTLIYSSMIALLLTLAFYPMPLLSLLETTFTLSLR